jgi:hypothetical protein
LAEPVSQETYGCANGMPVLSPRSVKVAEYGEVAPSPRSPIDLATVVGLASPAMEMAARLGGIGLLVVAFFFAVGGVIAIGNGEVLIGIVILALAVLLAVGGWSLRGNRGTWTEQDSGPR